MKVEVEEGKKEPGAEATVGDALRATLSGKQFKNVVAARAVCGEKSRALDLSSPVPEKCELFPVYADSDEGLAILRHSAAHVMAAAIKKLYPDAKVAIGPAIEGGFYYDFEFSKPIGADDLATIEEETLKLARAEAPFERRAMSKEEARRYFADKGENYKVELADAIEGDEAGIYTCGDFSDLCRGPHAPHTGFAKNLKLLSTAGAYWRGDEKNRMLTRIYGTAFADKKSLDERLRALEEAKKRDHRKLGRELRYFDFEETAAPGMVFWLPRGMLTRVILEDFWRKEHLKRGYELVQGPQLLRADTWRKSGHYDHYRENMYFTNIDGDEYGVKPMNCIGHMLIYNHDAHSYRDLPLRFFELGVVHRHEKSGVLHGLMRVRQFTQDDAHLICAPEQLLDEILRVFDMIRALMNLFDFKYKVAVSTRPKDSIGTDEAWKMATDALMGAAEKAGVPYEINEGDGAFYGPKIDVSLLDSLDRKWQCSTIQVDFTLPERFNLYYVGKDGEKHRPVMVHRAIMGSVERFIGILLEHYAGALPVWLAPEQARILTITDAVADAAKETRARLLELGVRVEIDLRNEKLGFKVREARLAKTPFILVVGEKEARDGTVSVRPRDGTNMGPKTAEEVAQLIRAEAEEPFKQGGMSYSFA